MANEGTADRIIRVILGLVLIYVAYAPLHAHHLLRYLVYIIGAIVLITGLVGFCPLYALLGIRTCPKK